MKTAKTSAKPAKKTAKPASKAKAPAKAPAKKTAKNVPHGTKAPAKKKASKPAPVAPMMAEALKVAKAAPGYSPVKSAPRGMDYAPFWSPFQTAIFDFIRFDTGSAIVEAVAGSGKTTTICEAIRYMRGSVCALAFNRSIAGELKERLASFPNVKAGTVHSIGKQAIEAANIAGWVKVDGDKLMWIWKDNLETKTNWTAKGNVCKLVTRAKDAGAGIDFRMDDVEAWRKLAEHFSIPTEMQSKDGEETFDIIALAIKLLNLSNKDFKPMKNGKTMLRIDFSDMIYLPVLLNLPLHKFDFVVVDEAQDLNLTRRLFIQGISHAATRHLIVGDTYQAIYGFTGADAESMANMKKTFNCQTFPLSVSYRCASAVIEYAQTWMPIIEASPSAPLGSVTDADYTKAMETASDTFAPSDVILCRNNAPLVKTAMQFIRANIPCRMEGNDLTARLIDLAFEHKNANLLTVRQSVLETTEDEVAAAMERGNNQKAGALNDMAETLVVFIDRAIETGATFEEMISMIKGFFSDERDGEKRELLTLSTIHKSKGREWNRVFWIDREKFQPSKFAKLEWELGQESNLCYVCATRAKRELVNLTNYP